MQHVIAVRLDDEQLAAVNVWRQQQGDPPTKAEAIRQLMAAKLMDVGLMPASGDKPSKAGQTGQRSEVVTTGEE